MTYEEALELIEQQTSLVEDFETYAMTRPVPAPEVSAVILTVLSALFVAVPLGAAAFGLGKPVGGAVLGAVLGVAAVLGARLIQELKDDTDRLARAQRFGQLVDRQDGRVTVEGWGLKDVLEDVRLLPIVIGPAASAADALRDAASRHRAALSGTGDLRGPARRVFADPQLRERSVLDQLQELRGRPHRKRLAPSGSISAPPTVRERPQPDEA